MLSDNDLRRLHQYGTALCGNPQEAYDLVHTAIEKILRTKRSELASLKLTYYYTTIRHCFIDSIRARRAQPEIDQDGKVEEVASVATRSLEDIVIEREELTSILAQLSAWERELLYLHLVEEQTAQEIAETTGKPRGTILSMMHRLRRKISTERAGVERGNKR